jgi:cobalt transporter subunit CbtA
VNRFRTLTSIVLLAGTTAGLLLFLLQHFTVFPLIQKAEVYESAAEHSMAEMHPSGAQREEAEWSPADGIERTLFTVLTTVLTAIGFAALLFGIAALQPASLDWRKGSLWGLAAFACIDVAPALGLPPQPPGVASADLYARQIWWVGTAISTAIGLCLLLGRKKSWQVRAAGLFALVLPHVLGAPASSGESSVPAQLIHSFALASILTTGMFWIVLGSIGGLLYRRSGYADML